MIPNIDIFDETNHSSHYSVLLEAINHLSIYKSETKFRDFNKSKSFIQFLKSKSRNNGKIELVKLIDLAFNYQPFECDSQKIILINEVGIHNGIIHRGLTGGFELDELGNGSNRQTLVLSTTESNLDKFYAIACHELGHIYGATRFRDHGIEITNNSIHCINEICAMHHPSYNEQTSSRRKNKDSIYCLDCQDGIMRF